MPTSKPRTTGGESRLLAQIRLAVGSRPDFLIARINTGVYSAPSNPKSRVRSAPNGFPDIIATQLRRANYTYEVNSTFSSFSEQRWFYYGQAVAIETKAPKGKLSEAQENWRDAFERVGGIYIVPRSVEEVEAVLGLVPDWVDKRPVK